MPATLASDVNDVLDAMGAFFDQVGQLNPLWLLVALVLYHAYLLLRSRALYNALRASYPGDRFQMRRIWGAYVTGVGMNNILPAGAGNLFQYVFTRDTIPSATYPVVVVALTAAAVFDAVLSALVLFLCFTTTRSFPHLADIAGLSSFDAGLYLGHPLFLVPVAAIAISALVLARTVYRERADRAWRAIRRGTRILRTDRYIARMVGWQAASWAARAAAYWYMLLAFRIGATPGRVLDVLGTYVLASVFPFTPSGVGIQQALIVSVFAGLAAEDRVAAFSVGQQLAFAFATLAVAVVALSKTFGIRGFRRALREARLRRVAPPDVEALTG